MDANRFTKRPEKIIRFNFSEQGQRENGPIFLQTIPIPVQPQNFLT